MFKIIPISLRTFGICVVFFVCSGGLGYASTSQERHLQIFANGKAYTSFSQYRSERLKKQMLASMSAQERSLFERFLVVNKGFTSIDANAFVDYDRFLGFYEEFQHVTAKSFEAIEHKELIKADGSITEMKAMLEGLQSQTQEAQYITLNPSKVKTIILKE